MRLATKLFLLISAAAAEATVAFAQQGGRRDDPNRLICRRMPETGSLAQTRRQCFTKAEWDRIAESARAGAEKTIDGLTSRPGGN
jgi:hypothetical protein